jgi:hypothetical protein
LGLLAYAIARIAKLKGGSVASAGMHVDRTRETPNADLDKLRDNRILIGEDRPLHELVTEMIDRHGGRPRSDSVECVELVLGASPEFFNEGHERDDPQRVRGFADKVTEFLHEQYGDRVVKATLHLDEKTPHVQAFMVPIDERGKLNCKAFFGTRQKLREFQNAYAAKMEPLGLERGIKGSRATHEKISRFYGAINREVRLRVAPERVPDPPRMMVTEASRQAYKRQVIEIVTQELFEPIQLIYQQSLLAREEKGKREAAEKRIKEIEREEREAIERKENQAMSFARNLRAEVQESHALRRQASELEAKLADGKGGKANLNKEVVRLTSRVEKLQNRLCDISLVEVMKAVGYRGEREGKSEVYRDEQGKVALTITGEEVKHNGEIVARNSIDLVTHMREVHKQTPTTTRDALEFLADTFGSDRALGANNVRSEQAAAILRVREQERERQREPERVYVFDRGR